MDLPSISITHSFPCDWMHLCIENHLKNLVALWQGQYKGLDEGRENYCIPDNIWVSRLVPLDKERDLREPDLAQLLGWALSHRVSDSNRGWFHRGIIVEIQAKGRKFP